MDRTPTTPQRISSCFVRAGTSVLALNYTENRLIAAGQQNFQLFSIEKQNGIEQFNELHDFRNAPRQSDISRYALQPKDVSWNLNDENYFATVSSTSGYLYIWDATRLIVINQFHVHNAIINRLQFHPKHANILLTASQDGYAKLIDFRVNNTGRVITTFRHSSKDGFRDIDINRSDTEKFAAVINDQYSVPIWDIRQPTQPDFSILTRDKVLSVSWNPNERSWLATGGTGGHDRTIRIWDAKCNDSRQEPLYTVYTFGQVTKLSWRPTCRYHIACSTRTTDQRIHVWDIRRSYLPQASFCHHRNDIEDFLWRANSDNIISVGRDERLVHAHISSAVKSEQVVSLSSLNTTSNGAVHTTLPNIDNDYVRSLYTEQHISSSSSSLHEFYSEQTMSTFLKWNQMIKGKSILGVYRSVLHDDSVRSFHRFARRWIFGNGEKCLKKLANVCDINSQVAEDLHRPDLKATWQVIKMLYASTENNRSYSTQTSRSLTKSRHKSDSASGHRSHHHPLSRRLTSNEKQQNRLFTEITDDQRKSQEQKSFDMAKLESIDDSDTYIVRDVLSDDIIFITPEDPLRNGISDDLSYDNDLNIEMMQDSILTPLASNELLSLIHTENKHPDMVYNRLVRQFPDMMMLNDGNELGCDHDFANTEDEMQTSVHSILPDGSDKFFTIDENYCPKTSNFALNFDEILRQTLWHYIENNELQVVAHLLLALYPQLNEQKRIELFNGAHLQWLFMYIELLQKMRLFVKAKQVTKHCIEKESIPLNYSPTDYDGSILFTAQPPTPKVLPPGPPPINKTLPPVLKEFMCAICRIPCRGQFLFCGGCFHGGHIDHIQTWFSKHDECPFGCSHRCQYRHAHHFQPFISKSPS